MQFLKSLFKVYLLYDITYALSKELEDFRITKLHYLMYYCYICICSHENVTVQKYEGIYALKRSEYIIKYSQEDPAYQIGVLKIYIR